MPDLRKSTRPGDQKANAHLAFLAYAHIIKYLYLTISLPTHLSKVIILLNFDCVFCCCVFFFLKYYVWHYYILSELLCVCLLAIRHKNCSFGVRFSKLFCENWLLLFYCLFFKKKKNSLKRKNVLCFFSLWKFDRIQIS